MTQPTFERFKLHIISGTYQLFQFDAHLLRPKIGNSEKLVEDQQISVNSVVTRSRLRILPRRFLEGVERGGKEGRRGGSNETLRKEREREREEEGEAEEGEAEEGEGMGRGEKRN